MSKKNKKITKLIKYGQLSKAIFTHIVNSFYTGLKAGESRHHITLTSIIDAVDYIFKSIKKQKEKKRKVFRVLKNLEKKQIINIREEGDNVYVLIKNKNHPQVIKYSIKSLLDFKKKNKKWNGKWFIVFFDVPEIQRNKRDYLRKFLKTLGFYQYQQSVYIFPFDCKKEIDLIKRIIEGAKYMKYIIADDIEDEEKIKKFFNI